MPDRVTSVLEIRPAVPAEAPDFVQRVTARLVAGEGDLLPVSAFPVDGTYPTGTTTQWEKRNIALEIPVWDEDLCIQCGECVLVCPHSVIRAKVYAPDRLGAAPASFKSAPARWREFAEARFFNRFYLPDFDLENLEVVPRLTLSNSYELLVRLHWVAILHGHVRADLAVTGGVHTVEDVLKAMMAGARVAMMTSALLKHGVEHLAAVRAGLLAWMQAREYESIRQMQGSMSYRSVREPAAFERANYMKVLSSYALRTEGARPPSGWLEP